MNRSLFFRTVMLGGVIFVPPNCLFFAYSKLPINSLLVLNDKFNNISVISWRSVLLVEETGVTGKNHRLVASH